MSKARASPKDPRVFPQPGTCSATLRFLVARELLSLCRVSEALRLLLTLYSDRDAPPQSLLEQICEHGPRAVKLVKALYSYAELLHVARSAGLTHIS